MVVEGGWVGDPTQGFLIQFDYCAENQVKNGLKIELNLRKCGERVLKQEGKLVNAASTVC